MKRCLSPLMGATLLAALVAAPAGHAWDWYSKIDGLKKAAAGLRQVASRALPSNFDQEQKPEITKQSTWLKSAASRCDTLARKFEQAAGAKGDAKSTKEFLSPNKAAEEITNLRRTLEKENGEFSFRSPEAKARQEEINNILKALGE